VVFARCRERPVADRFARLLAAGSFGFKWTPVTASTIRTASSRNFTLARLRRRVPAIVFFLRTMHRAVSSRGQAPGGGCRGRDFPDRRGVSRAPSACAAAWTSARAARTTPPSAMKPSTTGTATTLAAAVPSNSRTPGCSSSRTARSLRAVPARVYPASLSLHASERMEGGTAGTRPRRTCRLTSVR